MKAIKREKAVKHEVIHKVKTIKTILADDHKLFRKGLKLMCEEIPGISVIGEANNGHELLDLLNKKQPDLILMDLRMPIMDGVEAIESIKSQYPDIKIIVLSMYEYNRFISRLLELGINGYLIKNSEFEEMEHTINEVMTNDYCFNGYVNSIMRNKFLNSQKGKSKFKTDRELTPREREVITLVCEELTNAEIGLRLHLSPRTVEKYRKDIKQKTGAKNTAGIVYFALRNGLADFEE